MECRGRVMESKRDVMDFMVVSLKLWLRKCAISLSARATL